ncbi:uncharacterized protein LOC120134452 [Hibiscus syriacus]|uniref:uncharacterized protein LOC120134452 n=1 Tax=Hibiscus syriacus TaxID=106335 RepID=UPI001924F059|nr:uncharacterized protein LOC120134452 [Hibiscus syriacus]
MNLSYSYLVLSFQLLLLMCGHEIYAVKDLRENQGDVYHATGDAVKEFSQLVKELEDKYSNVAAWRSSVDKNPELSSQLVKELEDEYANVAAWRSSVEINPDLPSQLVKKLEDKYSNVAAWRSSAEINPDLSSQLTKEFEDI